LVTNKIRTELYVDNSYSKQKRKNKHVMIKTEQSVIVRAYKLYIFCDHRKFLKTATTKNTDSLKFTITLNMTV